MESFQSIPPVVDLSPTYYLDNFSRFIQDVVTRYHALLTPAEQAVYHSFMALSEPARCLYVRLISRKGPLFRRDKLRYPEIPDLDAAITELTAANMVAVNPAVRLTDLLPMFTHSELFANAAVQSRCSPMPKALRKPDLLQLICGNLRDQGESSERWYSLLELDMPVLQPAHIDVLERFRLLFFGHLGQDLTEFVLADLGLVQYENYPLEGTAAAFKHRWELDELLVAIQIRTQVEEMLEKWDAPRVADQIFSEGACSSLNFSAFAPAQRQIAKAYNRLGRELERQNFLEQAASFYRLSNQPPARERLARVLCAQKDYETAIALCDQILASPWDEHERTCVLRIRQRCLRQLGVRQTKTKLRQIQVHHVQLAPPEDTALTVERRALDYLIQTRQLEGGYVENWLINALFGLLFWDIIYVPVEDAFYHPFQRGPRDLYEPEFYPKRAALIEERLRRLSDGAGSCKQLSQIWQQKYGVANPFVYWSNDMLPLLEQAAETIPPVHLVAMFRRMLADLRNHCSGFPDLILFDRQGGYELIEVKGPGDRLQDHQRRWLEYFAEQGIRASVLYVSYVAKHPPEA